MPNKSRHYQVTEPRLGPWLWLKCKFSQSPVFPVLPPDTFTCVLLCLQHQTTSMQLLLFRKLGDRALMAISTQNIIALLAYSSSTCSFNVSSRPQGWGIEWRNWKVSSCSSFKPCLMKQLIRLCRASWWLQDLFKPSCRILPTPWRLHGSCAVAFAANCQTVFLLCLAGLGG